MPSNTLYFEATTSSGGVAWRSVFTCLFLGVELAGDPARMDLAWPDRPTPVIESDPIATTASKVRLVDAHVYSECARIWNPIHTDVQVARSAGLRAPILHGTATLARAVSAVADMAGIDLNTVVRVRGELAAMVELDTTILIRHLATSGSDLHFDVLTADGRPALRKGSITVVAIRRTRIAGAADA